MQFLSCFTAIDTSAPPMAPVAIHPDSAVHVGDVLVSAIILQQGSGAVFPVGADVTSFFSGTVAVIPQIQIAEGSNINFSGNYFFQNGGHALGGYIILGLWSRP